MELSSCSESIKFQGLEPELQGLLAFRRHKMRYHYEYDKSRQSIYGDIYECDHPVYSRCTLFTIGNKGLAIIQQRYDRKTKRTYWSEVDPWLTDALYLNENFKRYFDERADKEHSGLYPTVTIRQIMWALRMKPLPKKRWETTFDRSSI